MLDQLPNLFGRNFLIGYILPAALIVFAAMALLDINSLTHIYAGIVEFVVSGLGTDKLPVGQFGLVVLLIWALAVLLLGLNSAVTRLLEGYGTLNPGRFLKPYSLWHFRRLYKIMKEHDDERDAAYSMAAIKLAANFPEGEDLVLPTRFGNVVRAFERYPQTIYNMEPMESWVRLQSVAPAAHLTLVEDAKASLDFWINLWFGGIIIACTAFGLIVRSHHTTLLYLMIVAFAVSVAAAKGARPAAQQFGMLIKTTFDLYRGALITQLGLEMPQTLEKERALWTAVSQTFLFRDPDVANTVTGFRKKSEPNSKPQPQVRCWNGLPRYGVKNRKMP